MMASTHDKHALIMILPRVQTGGPLMILSTVANKFLVSVHKQVTYIKDAVQVLGNGVILHSHTIAKLTDTSSSQTFQWTHN